MLKLYQFPVSHYCEKVRWALELKDLPYRKVNLLPGPHVKKAKALASRSELPILEHKSHIVQGSREIITYLDNQFSRRQLTPEHPDARKLAMAWESYADREIGPPVRLLWYHTMLEHKDISVRMLSQDGPWYGNMMVKFAYPKMAEAMREMMNINDDTARQAVGQIEVALNNIQETLGDNEFLVADTFTRADLAVASLLAPLLMPKGYGSIWPETIPQPLLGHMTDFNSRLGWVEHLYSNFR